MKKEKEIISGVYKITNILNNKCYIGSSKNIIRRFSDHKYLLNSNKHYSTFLQRAWNKYGVDNFEFSILVQTSSERDDLIKNEQMFLDKFESYNPKKGFNILRKAYSPIGIKRDYMIKLE